MDFTNNTENMAQEAQGESLDAAAIKEKYGKVYQVDVELTPDDETTLSREYFFKRPTTASYDRYIKTASQHMTRALQTFLFDNVVEESDAQLKTDLEEYPAMTIVLGEKLLGMLGLTKTANLKML